MNEILRNARRIVVKVGSSLVTNEGKGVDADAIGTWCRQMAALAADGREVIMVSSGAIAEGMKRLGWATRPKEIHALQAAAAVGQMGLAAVALAVRGLVERDHRVPRRPQRRNPRCDAGAVARPAVGEQHVRLRAGVAPGVGGDTNAVDLEWRFAGPQRGGGACPGAGRRERRAEQAARTTDRRLRREPAADGEAGAQERDGHCSPNDRANSGRQDRHGDTSSVDQAVGEYDASRRSNRRRPRATAASSP